MLNKLFDLNGKVAIITGSSKGIGQNIAYAMAKQGAKVVLSSRNHDALDHLRQQFEHESLLAYSKVCHVGVEEELKELVEYTLDTCGRVDIVVNNAATNPKYCSLEDADLGLFDKMIQVNLKGHLP